MRNHPRGQAQSDGTRQRHGPWADLRDGARHRGDAAGPADQIKTLRGHHQAPALAAAALATTNLATAALAPPRAAPLAAAALAATLAATPLTATPLAAALAATTLAAWGPG